MVCLSLVRQMKSWLPSVQGSKSIQQILSELKKTDPSLPITLPLPEGYIHRCPCCSPQKCFKSASDTVIPKADSNTWEVLMCWHQTPKNGKTQTNRSLAICFSWQGWKIGKCWESRFRERRLSALTSFHKVLKAVHGIKASKWSLHGACSRWRKASLCVNTLI